MRNIKRITPFLENVNWFYLLHNQWNLFNSKLEAGSYVKDIKEHIKVIKEFWTNNPDLRISQVLVTLGILPNIMGAYWYMMEEHEILIGQHVVHPENCLFWGSIYTRRLKRRKQTKYILIKDMSKNHINNVFAHNGIRLHPEYARAFENILSKPNIFIRLWQTMKHSLKNFQFFA